MHILDILPDWLWKKVKKRKEEQIKERTEEEESYRRYKIRWEECPRKGKELDKLEEEIYKSDKEKYDFLSCAPLHKINKEEIQEFFDTVGHCEVEVIASFTGVCNLIASFLDYKHGIVQLSSAKDAILFFEKTVNSELNVSSLEKYQLCNISFYDIPFEVKYFQKGGLKYAYFLGYYDFNSTIKEIPYLYPKYKLFIRELNH